jgi:predicted DNA-binding transcriptional regulator
LKPLAEFDDEIKQEIERLKSQLKQLKKKKS